MKIKLNFCRTAFILLTATLLLVGGCSKKKSSSATTNSSATTRCSDNSTSPFSVSEITQTLGDDEFFTGSFIVPSNGVSFILSIFKDSNAEIVFDSLTDPDGTDILDNTSTPNLYYDASGGLGSDLIKNGYANVLVPQSQSFSAKKGTWTFKAKKNDGVKLTLRSGTVPASTTIVVQPYITGTTWTTGDLSNALSIMSSIYSANGITLSINSTITISDSQYAAVSGTFTDTTTSALVSQGVTDAVNLFFIEGYTGSWSNVLGNAAGIPGSMGLANAWNGVLISLTVHAYGTTLDAQLLGETAAHEMGHQLGLFHTTESGGTVFDIISDTAECPKSLDNDNNSQIQMSAEECEGYGAENVMFWTAWSSSSRSAGKKQETLSSYQQKVLKYSPIAK